jgi:hypothetical protein
VVAGRVRQCAWSAEIVCRKIVGEGCARECEEGGGEDGEQHCAGVGVRRKSAKVWIFMVSVLSAEPLITDGSHFEHAALGT